jgi:PAS domain S-box-containing protein
MASTRVRRLSATRAGQASLVEVGQWQKDLLQVAIEAADLAVWELDLTTRTVRASPTLHRLLGHDVPPQPWTPKTFEHHLFPDDLQVYRDAFEQALRSGELRCELRVRRKDGRIGWIAMQGKVGVDLHGRPRQLAGVVQDITDRRASEQFLREREAQFSAMFDVSSVGMAQADPATARLLRANERLAAMLGYEPDQLVGRRFLSFTHPDDRQASWAGLQQLLRGDVSTYQTEKRMMRKGGGIVWVLLTLNLVRDAGGVPQRLFAVVVDITERKLAEQVLVEREEDLRQVRDELERRVVERTAELAEANGALVNEIIERRTAEEQVRELLGRLVQVVEEERARISRDLHDTLGQHLAVLTLQLKAIEELAGRAPGARERMAAAQQAVRLIDDEVDRLSYELRPVALDDLGLDEALRSHAQTWSAECGVAIDVHTHGLRTGRLPALVETTVYRIVQEALTNVRKHAGASRVGLIAERRLDEVRVVIEDDGCGFDSASVTPAAGRRLGLRGMSERAGLVAGRLEIESLPGRGTTVYLAIPVRTDVDGPPEADA